jgi:CHAT domain-containing protein
MQKVKLTLFAFLIVSCFLIGQHTLKSHPKPLYAVSSQSKSTTLPVSRFNPERLKQILDRQDIAGAIRYLETSWKQQYEDYVKGELPSNQLVEVKEITQVLGNIHRQTRKKTALIYAVPTTNHLELILVTPGKPPIHKRIAAANQEQLLEVVRKFRTGVVNPNTKPRVYLPPAQQIYQWMLAPLESELQAQQINTLIFCLGKGLRTVPLAALHDGKRFLVEKYSFGIIPAFNLLDYQPASIQQTQILAMGASKFQNQPPLPAVPAELSAIANNHQGKSLLNQEFTLANLKAQRTKYPFGIVHLATHAEFSPGSVEQSYIQFWDSQLRLDKLKTLELRSPPVHLLVLSACRTALGNPQAELGFAGLAIQSGAKAAIASLWSVNDTGTLALMAEFYGQLKTAPIKTEALQKAQIAMLKQQVSLKNNQAIRGNIPPELTTLDSRVLSHPYYWAGFTLIGNPW